MKKCVPKLLKERKAVVDIYNKAFDKSNLQLLKIRDKTEWNYCYYPIIFVTAISREDQYVFKGYDSGAVDFMFKPLNREILTSKIKIFLELYYQKQHLSENSCLKRKH